MEPWERQDIDILVPAYRHIKEESVFLKPPPIEHANCETMIPPGLATLRYGRARINVANMTDARVTRKVSSILPGTVIPANEVLIVSQNETETAYKLCPATVREMIARFPYVNLTADKRRIYEQTLWEARDIFAWEAAVVPEAQVDPLSIEL